MPVSRRSAAASSVLAEQVYVLGSIVIASIVALTPVGIALGSYVTSAPLPLP